MHTGWWRVRCVLHRACCGVLLRAARAAPQHVGRCSAASITFIPHLAHSDAPRSRPRLPPSCSHLLARLWAVGRAARPVELSRSPRRAAARVPQGRPAGAPRLPAELSGGRAGWTGGWVAGWRGGWRAGRSAHQLQRVRWMAFTDRPDASSPGLPQAERAQAAHRRLSAAVLTVRRASVLFAAHDPLRPLMDVVLGLAASVGECAPRCCVLGREREARVGRRFHAGRERSRLVPAGS